MVDVQLSPFNVEVVDAQLAPPMLDGNCPRISGCPPANIEGARDNIEGARHSTEWGAPQH